MTEKTEAPQKIADLIPGPYAQIYVSHQIGRTRLALRGDVLERIAEHFGRENPHQVSRKAGVSYKTARRYLADPAEITDEENKALDLETFADIIIDGVGLSWEELADLPFGMIFAIKANLSKTRQIGRPKKEDGSR